MSLRDELFTAVKNGDSARLEKTLASDGREIIDAKDDAGKSAIYYAAQKGDVKALGLLLDSGASLGRPSLSDDVFKVTINNRHIAAMQLLLKRGWQVRSRDLVCAIQGGNNEALQILSRATDDRLLVWDAISISKNYVALEAFDVQSLQAEECDALYVACCYKNMDMLKKLLEFRANPNSEGRESAAALAACCNMYDDLSFVEALVQAGADVHQTYRDGKCAFYMAALVSNISMGCFILERSNAQQIKYYTEVAEDLYTELDFWAGGQICPATNDASGKNTREAFISMMREFSSVE